MKHATASMLLLCLLLLTLTTGCGQPSVDEVDVPGGYTQDRKVEAEDLAVFEAALKDTVGVAYEPTLVATQVVAGINYRFTATATIVTPDAVPYEVYIYIYQPLEGDPTVTEMVEIGE